MLTSQPLRATLVALQDIAEGEELVQSYCTDANLPLDQRQQFLLSYGFHCACPKCEMENAAAAAKDPGERVRRGTSRVSQAAGASVSLGGGS
jgi:hypothetical protein